MKLRQRAALMVRDSIPDYDPLDSNISLVAFGMIVWYV